jgi:hypothetical protein
MPTPHSRLDLTHARPGQRIHRSVTLTPCADGGARLTVHVGLAQLGADLSAADLRQLVGMACELQLAHQAAKVPA